jgi:hypothetical protein
MNFDLIVKCIKSYILISLILWGFAGYVYRVNSKRAVDDPLKKDFHPAAVFLTPLWPFLAIIWVLTFILRAVFYGIILILFTIGLVIIRKPFILIWLIKLANKVGNKLLQANMLLIRVLFPQQKTETVE